MPAELETLVADLLSFDLPRREAAVTALAAKGDEAVPALGELLSDPNSDVRRFALRALAGAHASPEALAPWVPKLVRSLSAADGPHKLGDPGTEEARLAHDVLVSLGGAAAESLIDLALGGAGAVGSTYARQLLAGYRERALPALTSALTRSPREVEEALRLLEQLGPAARPAVVEVLAAGRATPFPGGSLLAAKVLEASGAVPEATEFLRELLTAPSLRSQAARRLIALHPGDEAATAALVTLLRESPAEHRLSHALALAEGGPDAARHAAEILDTLEGGEPALIRLGPAGLEVLLARLGAGDAPRIQPALGALSEAARQTRERTTLLTLGARLGPALDHADATVRVEGIRLHHRLGLLTDAAARTRLQAELIGPASTAAKRVLSETGLSGLSASDRVASALSRLDAVGWFDHLPPRARAQVQRNLKRAASDGERLSAGLPCACLDCEDSSDEALLELARGSSGAFKPKKVRADPLGSDSERVSLELDGFPVAADVEQGDPEQLLALANRALKAAGREVRFFLLPGGAQESYAALTSPEAFKAAEERGLFKALDSA